MDETKLAAALIKGLKESGLLDEKKIARAVVKAMIDSNYFDQEKMKMSFFKSFSKIKFNRVKDGYIVKGTPIKRTGEKDLANKAKLRSDFTEATATCQTFRKALSEVIPFTTGLRAGGALMKKIYEVLKKDIVNERGNRTIHYGPVREFTGFNFNSDCYMGSVFYAAYTCKFDRKEGRAEFDLPPFNPQLMLNPMKGATHYKIITLACEMDFIKHETNTHLIESPELPLSAMVTGHLTHVHKVPKDSKNHLFLVMNLHFFQLVNGIYYRLLDKSKNMMTVLQVDAFHDDILKEKLKQIEPAAAAIF